MKRLFLKWAIGSIAIAVIAGPESGLRAQPVGPQQAGGLMQPDGGLPELGLRQEVASQLPGRSERRYLLRVKAGQLVHLVMERWNTDALLTLVDEKKQPVQAADSALQSGMVHLYWITQSEGEYSVQVGPAPQNGRFRLQLWQQRTARTGDQALLEAQATTRRCAALDGKWPEKLTACQAASGAWQKLQAPGDENQAVFGRMEAMAGTAYALRYLSRYAEQQAVATNLLALGREQGDRHVQAIALYYLGLAYAGQDEYGQALEQMERALAIYQQDGDVGGMGVTLNLLGGLHETRGDYELALGYFQRALPLFRELGAPRLLAASLLSIGGLHLRTDNAPTMVANLEEALALYRQLKDPRNEAVALRQLGRAQDALRQDQAALANLEASRKLCQELQPKSLLAAASAALATYYQKRKQYDVARRYLEEGIALWRASGGGGQSGPAMLHQLARLHLAEGKPAEALPLVEEALRVMDGQRTRVGGSGARATFLAVYRPAMATHVAILEELHRQQPEAGYLARAFAASERSRARGLQEMLAEAKVDVQAKPDGALAQQAQELEAKIQQVQAMPAGAAIRAQELQALEVRLERVRQNLKEEAAAAGSLAQVPVVELGEWQKNLLDGESVLLEFLVAGEVGFAWAITRERAAFVRLPQAEELQRLAGEGHTALAERDSGAWERVAGRLDELLLGALPAELRAKPRWLVALDANLHYVPMAALASAKGKELVLLPSAAVLGQIRERAAARAVGRAGGEATEIAVFADPVFSPEDVRLAGGRREVGREAGREAGRDVGKGEGKGEAASYAPPFPRLLFSRREATGIASVAGAAVRRYVDFAASRETLDQLDFSRVRILHFATHGLLQETNPEQSGLVLSQVDAAGRPVNGQLRLRDIYQKRLPVDLVVLSACQTALGKRVNGEGLVGLTRGLLYAGASRVLASLWKVDDAATAELMRLFYGQLLQKRLAPGAALAAAQAEMARQPRYRSPYYWAGFQLYGEYLPGPAEGGKP